MLLSTGSSGSGNIDLGIRLYLKDQFSAPAQKVKNSLEGLKDEFALFQDNLRSARAISATIAAVGVGLTMGLASAVSEGADFLFMMRSVEAITDATTDSMKQLSETVMEVGRQTIFTPEQVASGARFMAMAGQSADTINRTIGAAANLAGATLTRLEGKMGAADILTNAMKAFNWADERSAEMSDVLTLAANNANVSLTDMGNSLRYASATARNLKIPVREVTGLLMTLGNAGIQGSMSGTGLDNLFRYLSKSVSPYATKISKSAWKSLGLGPKDIVDAKGDLLPVIEILGKIKEASKDLGSVSLNNIMQAIFGVRGARPATLIMQSLEQTKGFMDMLADPNNAGAAASKMNLMMDSIRGFILKLQSAWSTVKAKLAEALGPQIIIMFKGFIKVLEAVISFMGTGFGKAVLKFSASAIVVATAIWSMRAAVAGLAYAFRTLNVSSVSMVGAVKGVGRYMRGLPMFAGAMAQPSSVHGTKRYAYQNMYNPIITSTGQVYSRAPTGAAGPKIGTVRTLAKNVPPPLLLGSPAAFNKGTKIVGIAQTSRAISMGARVAGTAAIMGRGLMGLMGGPVGIGITAVSLALPWLISAMSSNTSAIDKNTAAVEKAKADAGYSELYAVIANRSVAGVVEILARNLESLKTINGRGFDDLVEAFKRLEDTDDLEGLADALGTIATGTPNKGINVMRRK